MLRVAELTDARLSAEACVRPAGFDLAGFWRAWCAAREASRVAYVVTVRVAAAFVPELPARFGDRVRARIAAAGPADAAGRIVLELPFESLEAARARLLGFGRAVKVLAPYALRHSIRDYAEQFAELYAEPGRP